ncbi:MAG TPA: OmpH family outer membrane protein [Vicinamibacterales bacterium]|jgi:Skp family chaperone for outer membrane proteins
MRRFAVAVLLSLALGAVPTFALAQAKPTTPQKPASALAPAAQKPATPSPAQAAPQPPRPFPEGAKIAYMNIPRIAAESSEGKVSTTRVNALREKKLAELNAKNKQLETAQQKVSQGGNLLSEDARATAQKEVERIQVEIQRMQQDAEAEMQDLQQQLQAEFQRKLTPIIQQVAVEKGIHVLLSQTDAGMVWADPGLDLTNDIIKRFDAAMTGAKPPANPPQGQ